MKNSDDYKKEMYMLLPEITVETVINYCRKELKKYYSERKLHELEIARDEILSEEFLRKAEIVLGK